MSPRIAKASRAALWIGAALAASTLALFAANGLLSRSAPPVVGTIPALLSGATDAVHDNGRVDAGGDERTSAGGDEGDSRSTANASTPDDRRRLVVVAWNVARAGMYRGGARFASPDDVRDRLQRMAALLRDTRPDLVFLSEVVLECGPCPVDQVAMLAELTGLPHWAFGEEKSFGLFFYRLRSGNALLSRHPLRAVANEQLAGAKPFYAPTNNRRILWCDVELPGELLRVGSVRNDSFDLANNTRQVRQILAHLDGRPTLLAGDFNAEPQDESLALLSASGLFAGTFDGPATFPASAPRRRIDYVLAPRGWTVVSERILATDLSDHLPVVAVLER